MFTETTENGFEKIVLISVHFTEVLLIVCKKKNYLKLL